MSALDCDRFAAVLADLLADPPSGPADPRAGALREHAARCPACGDAADLVALALTPAERRDPIEDPGAAYWGEFNRRLDARLGTRRRLGRVVGLASAAVVAGTIIWVAIPRHAEVTGSPSATSLPAAGLDDAGLPDDDAAVGFGGAEPLDSYADDDAAALFPALDQLSPAESERLRLWLEEEEARVKRGRT